MLRQFVLGNGQREMVCWLEDDPRLRVGRSLTLKEVPGTWRIRTAYGTVNRGDIKRGWHNNI